MNVLVYSGPEALPPSLKTTLSSLQKLLRTSYSVQTVSPHALKTQPWSTSCTLFVFPECRSVNSSPWISSLDTYLEKGGSVLCLSSGAIRKTRSSTLQGIDNDSLRFFHKASGDVIYPTYTDDPAEKPHSRNLKVGGSTVIEGIFQSRIRRFDGVETGRGCRVLASYAGEIEETALAGVEFTIGSGKVSFWAPGLEYTATEDPARSYIPKTDIDEPERRRLFLLQLALQEVGIRAPSHMNDDTVYRPLPQFLLSSKAGAISKVLERIGQSTIGPESTPLKDENDTFHFHEFEEAAQLVDEARNSPSRSNDPATWQPKQVIVCREQAIPDRTLTPLFDITLFFQALAEARTKGGCQTDEGEWGCGEVFLYGEVVTSTQTMLDKNPRLLSDLPVPLVSLASHQIAGRGRGSNSWVSPAGCLQFSILLRVPLSSFPANKLVFVQYMAALAIVEACRDDMVLGKQGSAIRIKWPNDIYAVLGEGESDKKKIGGILVSTSFSDGKAVIIIGCGVNILNRPPIFSLSQIPRDSDTPLKMEKTAAAILAKFEKMWGVFTVGKGDFSPFMDLYLDRWLHSDQLVHLTTISPPTQVRICGITLDHGLLRTLPERTGWSTGHEGFIDLQPDGNSFDLMAGMIKSKS
ncbi:class II aaRS and biotin synthetase [Marasmius fiardii PR-910]|nr:class II aaRS and biotin synthetase [Marasmius fiardii PR-910]